MKDITVTFTLLEATDVAAKLANEIEDYAKADQVSDDLREGFCKVMRALLASDQPLPFETTLMLKWANEYMPKG